MTAAQDTDKGRAFIRLNTAARAIPTANHNLDIAIADADRVGCSPKIITETIARETGCHPATAWRRLRTIRNRTESTALEVEKS